MKKQFFMLFFIFIISTLIYAQWSDDPSINNAICDLNGEQAIPKVVTSSTGDTYIGYFSNDSGNYDVRLQRLDSQGNEFWDHNGILISDNPAMTWLTDWDMTVDADNYAILTFQDIRNGGNNNIYAYRIAPDGNSVWGNDGLELSNSGAFDASPKVCETSNGNIVVTWQAENVIIMQKISPDGTLLWGNNGITMSCNDTYSWPQPIAVEDDNILLKFFHDSGPAYSPTRHCYIQKYDNDGDAVWASDTIVSNAAGISAWTQVFNIISDDNNGCFISWHDSRGGGTISYPFVQHVNSDGTVAFAANGTQLSTETNRQNFYPESVYDSVNDELTTYWSQTDGNQNIHGITGQKLDAGGNLLWGANGNNIINISDLYVLPFAVRKANDNVIIFYDEGISGMDSYTKAMRLDADGNFVWEGDSVTMCSVPSEKVHSEGSFFANDQIICTWEDDRNGARDIIAQNINFDGTLGSGIPVFLTSFEAEFEVFEIEITWSTMGEPGVNGWNLLRSETSFEDAIQLNSELIPSTGSPTTPANYNFTDSDIQMGCEYYYWLECLFDSGEITYFGPITESVPLVLNPPQNLTVDPYTGEVSWDPPEPYPGAELEGYNLYRDGVFLEFGNGTNFTLSELVNGVTYIIAISAVYVQGESDMVEIQFTYTGTSINDNLIAATQLMCNYPNPFNPVTNIAFSIREAGNMTLEIYNLRGQLVKTLIDEIKETGEYVTSWNGTDNSSKPVSSGVYLYKMKSGIYTNTKKMILMK